MYRGGTGVAGKRSEGSTGRLMTAERWQRILRVMDEAFADYLTGMSTLRKRVVGDVKRKLSDGEVLDRPHLDQPLPRGRRLRRRGMHVGEAAATVVADDMSHVPPDSLTRLTGCSFSRAQRGADRSD